jgi:hypothetical protein
VLADLQHPHIVVTTFSIASASGKNLDLKARPLSLPGRTGQTSSCSLPVPGSRAGEYRTGKSGCTCMLRAARRKEAVLPLCRSCSAMI